MDPKSYVIVPYKNHLSMTAQLVHQILSQGECERVFAFNNGTPGDHATAGPRITTLDTPSMNIHEMLNAGLACAAWDSWPDPHNVLLANNDLDDLSPNFLSTLAKAMRENRLAIVSPDIEGSRGSGMRYGHRGDDAGVYGCAMMVPGESTSGFDTSFKWWFGDSDLVVRAQLAGRQFGVCLDASCVHLGSKTAEEYDLAAGSPTVEADRETFYRKWQKFGVVPPSKHLPDNFQLAR